MITKARNDVYAMKIFDSERSVLWGSKDSISGCLSHTEEYGPYHLQGHGTSRISGLCSAITRTEDIIFS